MKRYDEPALGRDFDGTIEPPAATPAIRDGIARLLDAQPFAVLCTQGGGQPYGSVVAFAASPALTALAFATPVATRKFRLLSQCDRVALVVDSRGHHLDDMAAVEAITATGRAARLPPGAERDRWAALLAARHPQLGSFYTAPSTALFRVDVVRYLHVTRFQEVHQWVPPRAG
jgi:nitroimidazol reductase NimA-like FMN-containing flavoprotein (pyridoxamine 5'-phosphate oxidase superfamily)